MKNRSLYLKMVPIMLSFFVMGFVDLVGIATNFVKEDFGLSDSVANLFPSMVFLWFLILSVPTGILMNRIGRKKTVLLSLFVTILAVLVPIIGYTLPLMLVSFSLLGIGNTLLQVSLNPLLSTLVSGEKLSSSLTFGQFVKAIASFIAPIIAGSAAVNLGDWKYLYPIFLFVSIIALVFLRLTPIEEQQDEEKKSSTFGDCFALLKDKVILLSFLGILCHVGIDVGVNTTAPKLLIERDGISLADATIATSIYFLFRTIGCLAGAVVLSRFSNKKFFLISTVLMILSAIGLLIFDSVVLLYVCIAFVGLGNSNIFPILLSQALLHLLGWKNEVSGLMMMGIVGGAVFPPLMGIASDLLGTQLGAVLVMSLCVLYLFLLTFRLKTN